MLPCLPKSGLVSAHASTRAMVHRLLTMVKAKDPDSNGVSCCTLKIFRAIRVECAAASCMHNR